MRELERGPDLEPRRGAAAPAPEASVAAREAPAPARTGRALDAAGVLRLQRLAGNAATTRQLQREGEEEQRSPVHDAIGRTGSPVDPAVRQMMEPVLATSLSDVQVVSDRDSTSSVAAGAYTVGNKVVVNPDTFQSGTPQAQRTLAHELTHVKQQREGPVAGTPQAGGIQVSSPHDRFEQEAERTADHAMSMQRQMLAAAHTPGDGHDHSPEELALQREPARAGRGPEDEHGEPAPE